MPRLLGGMTAGGSRRELHVFEIARLVVDADARRRDPARELSRVVDRFHQRGDEISIPDGGKPFVLLPLPCRRVEQPAVRRGMNVAKLADLAVEGNVGQLELEVDTCAIDDLAPAVEAA